MENKTNVSNENVSREEMIEKMLENGELHVMTECAYGKAIGADQRHNTLNNSK